MPRNGVWYKLIFYSNLIIKSENSSAIAIRDNIFLRILWGILVFFLAVFTIILIIAFFFFLGCPYEFVKCYLGRNDKDDDDSFSDDENQKITKNEEDDENKTLNWKDYMIIFFIIILGIFLQPLYLMFYVLMATVEFYRQCGCWVFWAYHN